MNTLDILKISPIIPVIALQDEKDALNLAEALLKANVGIMEVTLRTQAGLKAIELISKHLPEMKVGAGTVCNKTDMQNAIDAGSSFVFSPGISEELISSAKEKNIDFVPGVCTASEVMLASNNDIKGCKLFPATAAGGVALLKSIHGPFEDMFFCPTGGINQENFKDFLTLKNVLCVGGSWIVPNKEIKEKNFKAITDLCTKALNMLN